MKNKILQKATELALELPSGKHRLCAIVTDKRNKIISIGLNNYNKSHPRQAYYAEKHGNKHKIYLHAEMDALIKSRGKGEKIYIARVGLSGEKRLARPCKICYNAIKDSGIKNIYYTK